MRFYEFSDEDLDEDLRAALEIKAKALDDQSKIISNRQKSLKNRQAKQANRDAVAKMVTNSRNTK